MGTWDWSGQIEIGHKEMFSGHVYIPYLDSNNGYWNVDISQNPFNRSLKCMYFIVCKLYLHKVVLSKKDSLGTHKNANGHLGRDGRF